MGIGEYEVIDPRGNGGYGIVCVGGWIVFLFPQADGSAKVSHTDLHELIDMACPAETPEEYAISEYVRLTLAANVEYAAGCYGKAQELDAQACKAVEGFSADVRQQAYDAYVEEYKQRA